MSHGLYTTGPNGEHIYGNLIADTDQGNSDYSHDKNIIDLEFSYALHCSTGHEITVDSFGDMLRDNYALVVKKIYNSNGPHLGFEAVDSTGETVDVSSFNIYDTFWYDRDEIVPEGYVRIGDPMDYSDYRGPVARPAPSPQPPDPIPLPEDPT